MHNNPIGTFLGQYQIVGKIGSGGMATVYKGYHEQLDRHVAIKVLPANLAQNPRFVERFRREARAIARLDHPNIVPVYDSGQDRGVFYIVMKYVEGGTLKDIMKRGPLALEQAAFLLGQMAAALHYAHQRGVVHRDVKPSNVLMDGPNRAQLSDFGIAKITSTEQTSGLTGTGTGVGTADYMAPEQAAEATHADARADIYSLGVILYQMLTARLPFTADTPMAVMIKHMYDPIPRASEVMPDLPPEADYLIARAMAKEPDDRFQSAEAFGQTLADAAAGRPIAMPTRSAAPPSLPEAPDGFSSPDAFSPPVAPPLYDPYAASGDEQATYTPMPLEGQTVLTDSTPAPPTDEMLKATRMTAHQQAQFRDALAAYDGGDRELAQRLSLQILKDDDHVPEAWLLLSYIETNWYDQMQAAENALFVAPEMKDAQLRVEQLKNVRLPATFGRAYAVIPPVKEARVAAMEKYFRESQGEGLNDPLDDPYQCPYCGVVNDPERKVCSDCGSDMMRLREPERTASPMLRTAFVLAGGALLLVLVHILPVSIWPFYAGGTPNQQEFARLSLTTWPARMVLGEFYAIYDVPLFFFLLVAIITRGVLCLFTMIGLRLRATWAYWLGLTAFVIEIGWSMLAILSGWIGPAVGLASFVVGLAAMFSLVAASANFRVTKVRYRVEPDTHVKSGVGFFDRGRHYQRLGLWAMAVAQYRAAVGRAPNRVQFLKALAFGYNRLGRSDRALPVLEEAQRLDPADVEIAAMINRLQQARHAEAAGESPARQRVIKPLGDDAPDSP